MLRLAITMASLFVVTTSIMAADQPALSAKTHMYKLSHQAGDVWVEHSHPATFKIETMSGGSERLVAGAPAGDPATFQRLVESIEPPYFVLYVLHTPRGEGDAGRYLSPSLSLSEVQSFLAQYSAFLAGDSRFDLWVHSPSENATVIWDRHNLVYAYGPVERFASTLRGLGFQEGAPNVSFPHQHHYRSEFDSDAAGVLKAFEWRYSAHQPEDEQ